MPHQYHHSHPHHAHTSRTMWQLLRGDVRGLPRVVVFTVVSVSVYNIGWGFADPFFSLYLSTFSEQYSVIGFFRTLMVVIGIAVLIPLGDLLDRASHFKLMNIARVVYFFIGLFYFIAGATGWVPVLVVALLLNGAMAPFVWVSASATLQDSSNEKQAALISGFYLTTRQIAFGVGLALALWLVWEFPIHYIFIPVMFFPLVSMLFTRGLPAKHHQPLRTALQDVVVKDKIVVRWFRELKESSAEMKWLYLLFFLTLTIQLMALVYVPLYMQERGMSIVQIGVVLLLMNVPFLLSFLFAELAERVGRLRIAALGVLCSSVGAALFAVNHEQSWQLVSIAVLFMAGYAILIPPLSGLLAAITPKRETGETSATVDIVLSLAAVLFAPLIGYSIDTAGWQGTFVATAVFLGGVTLLTFYVHAVFLRRKNAVV